MRVFSLKEVIMAHNCKTLWMSIRDAEKIFDEVCVCDAGIEHCESGHTFGPAIRNFYLLHFVASGKGTFSVGGETFTLEKNRCFLIRPDETHRYSADKTDPWTYLWIGFRGSKAKEFADKMLGDRHVFDVSPEFILDYENAINVALSGGETLYRITSFVYRILSELSVESEKPKPDIVSAAIGFIQNNYHRNFDMSWLASELGMSRSHFSVVFGSAMGVSPYSYLTSYRISRAEKLLVDHPSLSITEVAYSVGFSSIERFSEMFKKHTGLSPLGYRKARI